MLPQIWRHRGSLLSPSVDDVFERFFYGWPSAEKDKDISFSPRVDVHETDKDILLDVEVPGLEKKHIKVEVKDNTLTISGERRYEKKDKDSESCRIERHYGKFARTFALPETVKSDKVSASYKNGVLNLKLPKTEKAIPKEITVNVE